MVFVRLLTGKEFYESVEEKAVADTPGRCYSATLPITHSLLPQEAMWCLILVVCRHQNHVGQKTITVNAVKHLQQPNWV